MTSPAIQRHPTRARSADTKRVGELAHTDNPGISRSVTVGYPVEISGAAKGFQEPPGQVDQGSYVGFSGLGIWWKGGDSSGVNANVHITRVRQTLWVDTQFSSYAANGQFFFKPRRLVSIGYPLHSRPWPPLKIATARTLRRAHGEAYARARCA